MAKPKINPKHKKIACNFTVRPETMKKLRKIKGPKSILIDAWLSTMPDRIIELYNEDPGSQVARFNL